MFKPKDEWGKQRPHSYVNWCYDWASLTCNANLKSNRKSGDGVYKWNRVIPNSVAGDEPSAERRYHPSVLEINKVDYGTGNTKDKVDRKKLFHYVEAEIEDSYNRRLEGELSQVEKDLKAAWPNLMKGIYPTNVYSVTVTIDDTTLNNLKGLNHTLALVRDVNIDGQTQNGNVVLATTEAGDLKTSQTFTWEETYEVYATQVGFNVSACILSVLMFRSCDDWHC